MYINVVEIIKIARLDSRGTVGKLPILTVLLQLTRKFYFLENNNIGRFNFWKVILLEGSNF